MHDIQTLRHSRLYVKSLVLAFTLDPFLHVGHFGKPNRRAWCVAWANEMTEVPLPHLYRRVFLFFFYKYILFEIIWNFYPMTLEREKQQKERVGRERNDDAKNKARLDSTRRVLKASLYLYFSLSFSLVW